LAPAHRNVVRQRHDAPFRSRRTPRPRVAAGSCWSTRCRAPGVSRTFPAGSWSGRRSQSPNGKCAPIVSFSLDNSSTHWTCISCGSFRLAEDSIELSLNKGAVAGSHQSLRGAWRVVPAGRQARWMALQASHGLAPVTHSAPRE
jgi:hypothetical protein